MRGKGSTATPSHQAFHGPRTFISFIFENDKWERRSLEKAGRAKGELAPGNWSLCLALVPGAWTGG